MFVDWFFQARGRLALYKALLLSQTRSLEEEHKALVENMKDAKKKFDDLYSQTADLTGELERKSHQVPPHSHRSPQWIMLGIIHAIMRYANSKKR